MTRTLRALALMSVALGACGEDQPPALGDFETSEPTGSSQTPDGAGGRGGTQSSGAGAGAGAASGTAASGGSTASYIPTPMETGPMDMVPVDMTGPMNTAGQGGASSNPPVDPCSLGTWTGDFSARSAADLQQLSGYRHVTGTLYVGVSSSAATTDVTSLSALSCLEQVDGSVTILQNDLLRDLVGLERLAFVGVNFTVSTNAQITTLEALTQLVVTDVLHIRANPQLTTLSEGILSVGGNIYINENAALPQCRAEELAAALGMTCNCEDNSPDGSCL